MKKKYPKYIIRLHYQDKDGIRYKNYWLYKLCDVVLDAQDISCMKTCAGKRDDCPYCYSINLEELTEHRWSP